LYVRWVVVPLLLGLLALLATVWVVEYNRASRTPKPCIDLYQGQLREWFGEGAGVLIERCARLNALLEPDGRASLPGPV